MQLADNVAGNGYRLKYHKINWIYLLNLESKHSILDFVFSEKYCEAKSENGKPRLKAIILHWPLHSSYDGAKHAYRSFTEVVAISCVLKVQISSLFRC